MHKATQLRRMFAREHLIRIVGAHNALGARLIERQGFDGVWASGLEISTAHGVPDANILTMSEYLAVAANINSATTLPVVADCDTGYGNVHNVIRMVREYEAAGIAAVVVEDKVFPKVNSYIPGRQELAPLDEFVRKIEAAKHTQSNPDFMVIARVEALIAGLGPDEARLRAKAYAAAGADAIVIHSKQKTAAEVTAFARDWDQPTPLVVIPTSYPDVSEAQLEQLGIRMVIYANQGLRSMIRAVSETLAEIATTRSLAAVEPKIAPMSEVFVLQGMGELKEHERRYLLTEPARAVIPAAGAAIDPSLAQLTQDTPVAMLDLGGKPLLHHQLSALEATGVTDVTIITGHAADRFTAAGARYVHNPDYATTGIAQSVSLAGPFGDAPLLVIYGDLLFERELIQRIQQVRADVALLVDGTLKRFARRKKRLDLALADLDPPGGERILRPARMLRILQVGRQPELPEAQYEFIGIARFSARAARLLETLIKRDAEPARPVDGRTTADLTDIIQEMIERGIEVVGVEVTSGWMEIHTQDDVHAAGALFAP